MPKVICKKIGCKKLIEKGINNGYCEEHKEFGQKLKKEAESYRLSNYNSYRRNSKETKFYNSKAWKDPKYGAKIAALTRDNYMCQHCLAKGIINHTNLEVHHIVPLKHDYSIGLELSNLVTLCRSCHKIADDKFKKYKIK